MSRDEFTTAFAQRLRNVLQKQARAQYADAALVEDGYTVGRQQSYDNAQTSLDATVIELADFVYDALESEHTASPQ